MNIKQTFQLSSRQAGFTLIELIIVIAIIALLAAATFVAVNPAKRMGDANDAQRWQDATAIADAINLYAADNSGSYPANLDVTTLYEINRYGVTCVTDGCVDQSGATNVLDMDELIDDGYIGKIPYDPETTTGNCSDYWVRRTTGTNKIEVGSCKHYSGGSTITVIR